MMEETTTTNLDDAEFLRELASRFSDIDFTTIGEDQRLMEIADRLDWPEPDREDLGPTESHDVGGEPWRRDQM